MNDSKAIDPINRENEILAIERQWRKPLEEVPAMLPCKCETEAENYAQDGPGGPLQEKTAISQQLPVAQPDAGKPEPCVQEQDAADETQNKEREELSNRQITDHTSGLWKYLPIPSDEPEPAPEYLQCCMDFPGGQVIAARVRGKKHKHEGSNCDDWYEIANVDDITFIAVSDGAGSKKFSRIGARVSCKTAVGYLVNSYTKLASEVPEIRDYLKQELTSTICMNACGKIAELIQKAVIQAREAVEAALYSRAGDLAYSKLLKRNLDLSDLSGTLLVAAIIPLNKETKEHLIVTCQVGDGMIVSLNSKGPFQTSVKLLGVPDSGDFSGETEFLTAPQMKNIDALQKRTKLSRGITDTVMLMSDGVADDYFPNETQMRRLYFDLIVNGVIEQTDFPSDFSMLSGREIRAFKKIPDPVFYPWVNDKSITVPIQYTSHICKSLGISLEELWENRMILGLAWLELKEEGTPSALDDRLRIWLDNYYERGSFDDRTLVVMRL